MRELPRETTNGRESRLLPLQLAPNACAAKLTLSSSMKLLLLQPSQQSIYGMSYGEAAGPQTLKTPQLVLPIAEISKCASMLQECQVQCCNSRMATAMVTRTADDRRSTDCLTPSLSKIQTILPLLQRFPVSVPTVPSARMPCTALNPVPWGLRESKLGPALPFEVHKAANLIITR